MVKIVLIALLVAVSLPVHSEKIVITGKPAILQLHPGYFTFPKTYTDMNTGFDFVTITGTNRVCFLRKQPALAKLDTIQIVIEKNGLKLPWNCYQYNSMYFKSDF